MHPTTSTAPRSARRWVFMALLGVLLLLALAQAVPAHAASAPFDGGPLVADTSTFVANDHTVYAFRFANTTGGTYPLADGTYFVKVRFTPNADGSPAGSDNRGFTWNPSTALWAQEREDWTAFPTVTVTSGLITGGSSPGTSDWFYYKFGDTSKSGTYYLMVSLSVGTSGNTKNSNIFIPVATLNPTSTSFWVHAGPGTNQAGKRASAVDYPTAGNPVALQRSEPNSCDDDANGVVDDEVYGRVQSGGFRLAVPTAQALVTLLPGTTVWPSGSTGFNLATTDVDIALGETDQTAPTAPSSPVATAQAAGAVVSWTAASDTVGVTGYHVYRWTDAPAGAGYTPMPAKVATVTSGTSYTDTGLTNGAVYHYVVRAFDEATNIGPRSTIVDVTPKAAASLTLQTSATTVNWGMPWTLSGALTSSGAAIPDAAAKLMQSLDSGSTWTLVNTLTPATGTSTYSGSIAAPPQKSQYKLVFDGDAWHASCESTHVTVTPRVKLGKPVAPATVKKKKSFSVYGSLTPQQTAGSRTVKIQCYLRKSGKWVLKKTVPAKNADRGSATRYSAKMSLPTKGSWRLVAVSAATAKYAATKSGNESLRVK